MKSAGVLCSAAPVSTINSTVADPARAALMGLPEIVSLWML